MCADISLFFKAFAAYYLILLFFYEFYLFYDGNFVLYSYFFINIT